MSREQSTSLSRSLIVRTRNLLPMFNTKYSISSNNLWTRFKKTRERRISILLAIILNKPLRAINPNRLTLDPSRAISNGITLWETLATKESASMTSWALEMTLIIIIISFIQINKIRLISAETLPASFKLNSNYLKPTKDWSRLRIGALTRLWKPRISCLCKISNSIAVRNFSNKALNWVQKMQCLDIQPVRMSKPARTNNMYPVWIRITYSLQLSTIHSQLNKTIPFSMMTTL